MKVLQLIDSLEAGGAERVAVTYANSLSVHMATFLCATRAEGTLKETINKEVNYLFLKKNSFFDIKAILKLNKYIKQNSISIIHAHSSSFFLATLMKCLNYKLKIVWHDHYGNSEALNKRPYAVLKICSLFFNTIIAVNSKLKNWSEKKLYCKNVFFLPNFISKSNSVKKETFLKGKKEKRIICLANLRAQKDHITLLQSFLLFSKNNPEWTLHLVGKDFTDNYSQSIYNFIEKNKLSELVFVYGSCIDIPHILSQSSIGVLSSKSEGLPMALLEYGLASLPVVITDVGDCNKVVKNNTNGLLVKKENPKLFYEAIDEMIHNNKKSSKLANTLHHDIIQNYTEFSMMNKVLKMYQNII